MSKEEFKKELMEMPISKMNGIQLCAYEVYVWSLPEEERNWTKITERRHQLMINAESLSRIRGYNVPWEFV